MSGTNSSWRLVPGRRLSSGRASFGALLKQLQQAAGYLPYDTDPNSPSQDILFDLFTNVDEDTPGDPAEDYRGKPTRLQRQLTIGYFGGENSILEADNTNLNRGIAKQIVDRLAVYLVLKLNGKELKSGPHLVRFSLLNIECICLRREWQSLVDLSPYDLPAPLPLLSCGINAIGRSDLLDGVSWFEPRRRCLSPSQMLAKSQLDQLLFAFVPGNIGEFAGSLFSPSIQLWQLFGNCGQVNQISPVVLKSDRDRNIESVSPVVLGEAAQKLLSMEKVRTQEVIACLLSNWSAALYQLLQHSKTSGPVRYLD